MNKLAFQMVQPPGSWERIQEDFGDVGLGILMLSVYNV